MKKALVVIMIIIAGMTIQGCGSDQNFSDYRHESIIGEIQCDGKLKAIAGNRICSEWIDTETGVHYWFAPTTGFTPRHNADGTIMVEKVE